MMTRQLGPNQSIGLVQTRLRFALHRPHPQRVAGDDRTLIQKRATAAADGSRSPTSLAMALARPVVATLCPSFFVSPSSHPRLTFPPNPPAIRHRPVSYPRIRALDLDQDTVMPPFPSSVSSPKCGALAMDGCNAFALCFSSSRSPWGL